MSEEKKETVEKAEKIFLGSSKPSKGQYGGYIHNMCYDDIPEDKLTTAANGKRYFSFFQNELREPAEDRTHYLLFSDPSNRPEGKIPF